MCKGGGDGCIARSHGGEGTRSGGSAVVTLVALGEPPPSLPLLIMQSLLGSWKGAQGPYRVGGEILNVLLLEEDGE